MRRADQNTHIARVTNVLSRLEDYCLGRNTDLTVILPDQVKSQPELVQVKQVADQLTYSIAAVSSYDSQGLLRTYHWLYGAILYLFRECHETDRTFSGLAKLLEMPHGLRKTILPHGEPAYTSLREDVSVPGPLSAFDDAVPYLLLSCNKYDIAKDCLRRAEACLWVLENTHPVPVADFHPVD